MLAGNFPKTYKIFFTIWLQCIVSKDREGMLKGGLLTLIKDTLNYTEIKPQDDIECILVKITRAHHGDEIPERDVSSYLFTYLPLNYDTPVVS